MSLEVPLALSLRDRVNAEVRGQARSQADVVAASAPELLAPGRRADLQRLAQTAGGSVRGRVIVVDGAGRVVADSTGAGELGGDYSARPEIASALRGRTVQTVRYSRTLRTDLLATSVPILRAGRPAGAVRVTQSVQAVGHAVRRAIFGLAAIGGVVLLLGLAAGALIAAEVARPIRRLDRAVRRVAEGDLDVRAPVEGSTEQRSLARTFNEMTARVGRLVRSQREFVADASHQLRTPLTGLRLRLEELRDQVADDHPDAATLDAGMREVDRLAAMVDELLVLSRAGERQLPGESIPVDRAIERAIERWRPAAEEARIELAGGAGRDGAVVWCAESDLDRALDVLIENALHYSAAGTQVTVESHPGGVEVLDQGPGLAPEEAEAVFERFHRGRAGRQGPSGTGLGLSIARELAREWGGTVTIANRRGGGARARIELPPGPRSGHDGPEAGRRHRERRPAGGAR